jgi:hypothetical protein
MTRAPDGMGARRARFFRDKQRRQCGKSGGPVSREDDTP